ncbi:hypothetical protein ABH922_003755 [Rhodococcus sp. 27YEA15]
MYRDGTDHSFPDGLSELHEICEHCARYQLVSTSMGDLSYFLIRCRKLEQGKWRARVSWISTT